MRNGQFFVLLLLLMIPMSGCLDDAESETESPTKMEAVTGSIQGNVTQVWFTVNSTDEQALMVESLYISHCSPTDDDVNDETGEYPYQCNISRNSLKVNSTCNNGLITNYARAGNWLPTGNCVHEFGELGLFDEGYQHLAPYRNATWNLMYSIHSVDSVN